MRSSSFPISIDVDQTLAKVATPAFGIDPSVALLHSVHGKRPRIGVSRFSFLTGTSFGAAFDVPASSASSILIGPADVVFIQPLFMVVSVTLTVQPAVRARRAVHVVSISQ
jgi:hypothetical protein